jgi:cysteinyl-tRNA synthetase
VARGRLDSFDEVISDELNTAKALVAVTAASRDELLSAEREFAAVAVQFDSVLGIGLPDLVPRDLDLKRSEIAISDEAAEVLVGERTAAGAAKDFAKSDELRERHATAGVTVEDHPGGTSTWRWS